MRSKKTGISHSTKTIRHKKSLDQIEAFRMHVDGVITEL
jgi:hypothetical protein